MSFLQSIFDMSSNKVIYIFTKTWAQVMFIVIARILCMCIGKVINPPANVCLVGIGNLVEGRKF